MGDLRGKLTEMIFFTLADRVARQSSEGDDWIRLARPTTGSDQAGRKALVIA